VKLSKLKFSKEASSRVRFLAGKTGLTPNLLCRLGFCMSLAEPGIPNPADYPEEDREFNRYTLLGEYDALFIALLKERHFSDGCEYAIEDAFRAHMNRGIIILQRRLKDIGQLADLVSGIRASIPASAGRIG
jgi:DNA sulfur modification protein DndE